MDASNDPGVWLGAAQTTKSISEASRTTLFASQRFPHSQEDQSFFVCVGYNDASAFPVPPLLDSDKDFYRQRMRAVGTPKQDKQDLSFMLDGRALPEA